MVAILPEKVILCCVSKDVGSKVAFIRSRFEQIGNLFSDYRVIISEYNSQDNTPRLLYQWMSKNSKVFVIASFIPPREMAKWVVNTMDNNEYFADEQLAYVLNNTLRIALSEAYDDFKYIIWLDANCSQLPSDDSIVEVFQAEREWDAVVSYGEDSSANYYDWPSHRDSEYPIGVELVNSKVAERAKFFKLYENDNWYPVYSAYGGCGIYKKEALNNCAYSALVTSDFEKYCYDLIYRNGNSCNLFVLNYFDQVNNIEEFVSIPNNFLNLPKITNNNWGIRLNEKPNFLVWRMSSGVCQYPVVNPYVSFHASMIMNGFEKIFINPRMRTKYLTNQ